MNAFRKMNLWMGWAVFALSALVYFLTTEPTTSWWDCGEYISTAFKLQVGHPPGAPLFQMLGRFFSLFAFGDTSKVALMINSLSVISSGLTIMFLFWTITHLGLKLVGGIKNMTRGSQWAVLGSGLVGALAYTFTDSFWFSAVEGEVYAMASLFTAMVFWAILRWEQVADEPGSFRWILLIAYLMGLSIGVHLLSLLTIPSLFFVYYFKKFEPGLKGVIITGLLSIVTLAFIQNGVIPEIANLFAQTELTFVNGLGLPFNSGTVVFALVLVAWIVVGVLFTVRADDQRIRKSFLALSFVFSLLLLNGSSSAGSALLRILIIGALAAMFYYFRSRRDVLNVIILSFAFLLIGYSSFLMIVIRANANTPINENSPDDAISLLAYLNREQYGSWPLLTGQYFNAPVDHYLDGTPIYVKDSKSGTYIITDNRKQSVPGYDKRFTTFFPRMWSNTKPSHISVYKRYMKNGGIPITTTRPDGTKETKIKPTFGQNLTYFFKYQLGHMYWRYFFWNFVGRQNDIESQGELEHGNWISGINAIDTMRLGEQHDLPHSMQNSAHNRFFFLPLILGLVGLYYQLRKNYKDTFVVALLFFMTGLAIIIFLNLTPYQPRERDYAFAGSFYAFAIWIGLGVLGLYSSISKMRNQPVLAIGLTAGCLLLVPGVMAREGWDDHDRSGKTATLDFARNYLESCAPNAILITNGDNDTFPLWYAQEVEGIRTDVRVVNYMLAGGSWYVHQMARKVYESDPLPLKLTPQQYNKGVNEAILVVDRNLKGYKALGDIINFVADDNDQTKLALQDGRMVNYLPTRKLMLPVDKEKVLTSGLVPEYMANDVVDQIQWDVNTNYLYKNDLMLLDFIAMNQWERPIYFANPSSVSKVLGIEEYCHLQGFVYKFMPVKAKSYMRGVGGIDARSSYTILKDKCKWGNLNHPDVTVDRESFRNSLIPKQNFIRVAQQLLELGEKEKAIELVDYCLEIFPNEKFAYDIYMMTFVDVFYKAGAVEKANTMVRDLVEIYSANLDYYQRQKPVFISYYSDDMQEAMGVIQRLMYMARQNQQEELAGEIEELFNSHLTLFS